MVQKSKTTTWEFQTLLNHGINYQPQQVSSPDFWLNHQQYSPPQVGAFLLIPWIYPTFRHLPKSPLKPQQPLNPKRP